MFIELVIPSNHPILCHLLQSVRRPQDNRISLADCCHHSVVKLCPILCHSWTIACQGFPFLHHLSEVCSKSCLSSQWCHPTISSFVTPFSSCLQSVSASGSFPLSRLFESGGQSIKASASASVPPMNIQGWFPLGLTGLILQSKGLLKSLFQHHNLKASIL